MTTTKQFLDTLSIEWSNIEFTSINEWKVSVLSEQEALNNKTANIYFLWGVRKDLVYWQGIRAKDADIVKKRYFCIDIDMRKNFEEEFWEKCSDEDIIQEWLNISKYISELNEYFSEWRYIVFSGNGIHLYYVSDSQEISKEDYNLAVERIFRQWDKIVWSKTFSSDHACKNIARILRLPWSINQKNWSEVKIIAEQDIKSRLVDSFKTLADTEKQEAEDRNKIKQKEIEQRMSTYSKDDNNLYEVINQIPSWQIAQILLPQFPFDWKKNFKNEKWWFCWYFYNAEDNTIVNGWSRFFNWWYEWSWWNNFSLVKRFKNWTDRETFEYFKTILKINK